MNSSNKKIFRFLIVFCVAMAIFHFGSILKTGGTNCSLPLAIGNATYAVFLYWRHGW